MTPLQKSLMMLSYHHRNEGRTAAAEALEDAVLELGTLEAVRAQAKRMVPTLH